MDVDEYRKAHGLDDLLSAPLPRYPHGVHPTASNWFRTTINPLIWNLVESKSLPPDEQLLALARLWEKGIYVDFQWGISFFAVTGEPIDRRVAFRPDALLSPRITRELFKLLTSGRTSDHQLASEALRRLAMRKPPGDPVVEQDRPEVRVMSSGRRSGKRPGREELTEDVSAQLESWTLRAKEPTLSQNQVIQRVGGKLGMSDKSIRNHLAALTEYLELLKKDSELQESAVELYGMAGSDLTAVALRSQREAHEWLAAPPV